MQLPPDTDLPSVRLKLAYDLYYVAHCGLGLDLRLLGATALKMFGLPYAIISSVLILPRREFVENLYRALVDDFCTSQIVRRRGPTDSDNMIDLEMALRGYDAKASKSISHSRAKLLQRGFKGAIQSIG